MGVGRADGAAVVGTYVGAKEGLKLYDGTALGTKDGTAEGAIVGLAVGARFITNLQYMRPIARFGVQNHCAFDWILPHLLPQGPPPTVAI